MNVITKEDGIKKWKGVTAFAAMLYFFPKEKAPNFIGVEPKKLYVIKIPPPQKNKPL